ncbi:PA2778 family cysteine peptidase [Aliikangiella sp. IMCC44632]
MLFHRFRAGISACFLLLCSGCISTAWQTQQIRNNPPPIKPQHLIKDVPFFPQQQYYCGPTTLAEVANYYQKDTTPDSIAPALFIPEFKGTLQIELQAAARQQGLLAYADNSNIAQLLTLLSEDIPVIVLQNLGTDWLPQWHYAVAIGYNLNDLSITLHSGQDAFRWTQLDNFERTWKRSNYWLLVALPATKISTTMQPIRYLNAAQDLVSVQQTQHGLNAMHTAQQKWPNYWLSYFLLGNYYLKDNEKQALAWYLKGEHLALNNISYLNNLAFAFGMNGCQSLALATIEKAIKINPNDSNLRDSKKQILAMQETEQCSEAMLKTPLN